MQHGGGTTAKLIEIITGEAAEMRAASEERAVCRKREKSPQPRQPAGVSPAHAALEF